MKVRCSKCKEYKKSSSFYKDVSSKRGFNYWCKDCSKEYLKIPKNRNRKRESDREYQRKKRARLKGYKTQEFREYRNNNPEKYKAQTLLNTAVRSGKIKRSPCEICGESRKYRVHAHHDDYSEPYQVRWLCPIHHKLAHQTII